MYSPEYIQNSISVHWNPHLGHLTLSGTRDNICPETSKRLHSWKFSQELFFSRLTLSSRSKLGRKKFLSSSQNTSLKERGASLCCLTLFSLFPAIASFPFPWEDEEENFAIPIASLGRILHAAPALLNDFCENQKRPQIHNNHKYTNTQ